MARLEVTLQNKMAAERANLKGVEIAKVANTKEERSDFTIEIVNKKGIKGGVVVFGKAWKGADQIGFGKDGSVDIERFQIFNPPILVDDPNGDIVRQWVDELPDGTKVQRTRTLREDHKEALMQVIEQNLSTMKNVHVGSENIKTGKIGRTTSTFYPDADTETTCMDANYHNIQAASFSTVRGASTTTGGSDNSVYIGGYWHRGGDGKYLITRSGILFDTSALGGDTVLSADLSLYYYSKDVRTDGDYFGIYDFTPSSNTGFTSTDYALSNWGSTLLSNSVSFGSLASGSYEVYTLNASGELAIDTSGITKFGLRTLGDVANSNTMSGTNSGIIYNIYSADQAGTTTDPKLVVTHEAELVPSMFLMF